jgi:hypothetical protein
MDQWLGCRVQLRAAVGFGLDPDTLRPLGGRSGSAWSDGHVVLRGGERVACELPAIAAAAGHLPVPQVLGRLELDGTSAVLLERLPGRTILTLDPAAQERRDNLGWVALTDHWLQAGRMHALSAAARMWACRFMLADLAARHTGAELAHVRHAMRLVGAERHQQLR